MLLVKESGGTFAIKLLHTTRRQTVFSELRSEAKRKMHFKFYMQMQNYVYVVFLLPGVNHLNDRIKHLFHKFMQSRLQRTLGQKAYSRVARDCFMMHMNALSPIFFCFQCLGHH